MILNIQCIIGNQFWWNATLFSGIPDAAFDTAKNFTLESGDQVKIVRSSLPDGRIFKGLFYKTELKDSLAAIYGVDRPFHYMNITGAYNLLSYTVKNPPPYKPEMSESFFFKGYNYLLIKILPVNEFFDKLLMQIQQWFKKLGRDHSGKILLEKYIKQVEERREHLKKSGQMHL